MKPLNAYWWLSFVDPEPDQFLGVCIVEADNIAAAAGEAHLRGCNPGGSIQGWEMFGDIPAEYLNRLVTTKNEASLLGEMVHDHVTETPA